MLISYDTLNGFAVAFTVDCSLPKMSILANGTEPFYETPELAYQYQLVDGQWQERTWVELQIIKTTYPLGQCIVQLSNSDILTFECLTSWVKADVIAAINSVPKYASTVIS